MCTPRRLKSQFFSGLHARYVPAFALLFHKLWAGRSGFPDIRAADAMGDLHD
jgi:hypothetical protein